MNRWDWALKLYIIIMLIALAATQGGCGTTTEIIKDPVLVTETIYETMPVPETLLRACTVDLSALKSNKDLESTLAAAILELQRCTEDKVAISELE